MTRCPDDLRQRLSDLLQSGRKLWPEYEAIGKERNVKLRQVQRWASHVRAGLALQGAPSSGDVDLDAMLLNARIARIEAELERAVSRGDVETAKRLLAEKRSLQVSIPGVITKDDLGYGNDEALLAWHDDCLSAIPADHPERLRLEQQRRLLRQQD